MIAHKNETMPLLQVSPAFGFFFLNGELKMNECTAKRRILERQLKNQSKVEAAS